MRVGGGAGGWALRPLAPGAEEPPGVVGLWATPSGAGAACEPGPETRLRAAGLGGWSLRRRARAVGSRVSPDGGNRPNPPWQPTRSAYRTWRVPACGGDYSASAVDSASGQAARGPRWEKGVFSELPRREVTDFQAVDPKLERPVTDKSEYMETGKIYAEQIFFIKRSPCSENT